MPSAEPRWQPQPEPAVACEDPVFVLCTGRSGSTLVRFLLDAHPDLACPPETRLPWLCTQLATAWSVIEGVSLPSGDAGKLRTVPDQVVAGLRQSLYPMVGSYLARRGKAWQQVLSGGINLGVAFRRGELRYADKGDAGAGSAVADNRVAMMAELLGVIRWQPASS